MLPPKAKPSRIRNLSRRSALKLFSIAAAYTSLVPGDLWAAIDPDWTTSHPPFRIAANLYYVGSRELASFLITTQAGHILINGNLPSSPGQVRASVQMLGFHWQDIKILLISHAHYDHCGGSGQILKESGAKYMVMDADVPVVESGGKQDFHFSKDSTMFFPPAQVDRILRDGDPVRLGATTLTAHKTAGHTKGCTTWSFPVQDSGQTLNAIIVGSPNVLASYNLIDDPNYPQMASDFKKQFVILRSLPCDIFLGAHASSWGMLEKFAKLQSGNREAFIDPTGYRSYVADRAMAFQSELARQQKLHSARTNRTKLSPA